MTKRTQTLELLREVSNRLVRLEHEAELMRNIFIVKEPDTVHAANAYEGLRKQVVAATSERMSHLTQLAFMAVAVDRASSVDDLRPQVQEWLRQAGVVEVREVPASTRPSDLFEDVDGGTLDHATAVEVLEPAYVDSQTGRLLRLGRARPVVAPAGTDQVVVSLREPADVPSAHREHGR
jgi:hypothetical protein